MKQRRYASRQSGQLVPQHQFECLQVRSLRWVLKNYRKRRTNDNRVASSKTKHMGRSSNGKTSVLQAEDRGSIPRCSTHFDYGSVGNRETTLA